MEAAQPKNPLSFLARLLEPLALAWADDGNRAPRKPQPPVPEIARLFIGQCLQAATPADRKRLALIVTRLSETESGAQAVSLMMKHNISLAFDTRRGGAGYFPGRRHIALNRTTVVPRAAMTFMHEATHARFHLAGIGANVQRDDRQGFAQNILMEEVGARIAEIQTGRELLHLARAYRDPQWTQYLTNHPLKMWMHLVHGASYGKRPTEQMLVDDRRLSSEDVDALLEQMEPYLYRYVEPYRAIEIRKWDIYHGYEKPIDPTLLSDVLADAMAEQPHLYPRGRLMP